MVKLADIRERASRERRGQWFNGETLADAPDERDEDGAWYICVAPSSEPGVRRVARELARELAADGPLEDGASKTLSYSAHIVDWQGIDDVDYSPMRAYRLLRDDFPEYEGEVLEMIVRASTRAARSEAASEGN